MNRILIFFMLLLLTDGNLQAETKPQTTKATVQVGVLDFPPIYEVKSHTQIKGYYTLLLAQVLEEAGYPYEIKGYSASRLYQNLAEGETHLWLGLQHVPQYEGKVLVSKVAATRIQLQIYFLGSTPAIKGVEGVKGKRLIMMQGYGYNGLREKLEAKEMAITMIDAPDHASAFRMLKAGRGDYLLNFSHPSKLVLSEEPIPGIQNIDLYQIDGYFIVSKKAPQPERLLADLEAAYSRLRAQNKLFIIEVD